MRRFATPRDRRLLWYQSDGRCVCGSDLPENFHVDHDTVPWSIGHVTNIHDLRALCPTCNLRKGNRMLRKFQREAQELAKHPNFGSGFNEILADVTPGGGKGSLDAIFFSYAKERGLVQKVASIVPRESLKIQAELAFQDTFLHPFIPRPHKIRAAGNDINPSRGTAGYVTTYQAVSQDPRLHTQELERWPYMLVLDEIQFVEAGSAWHQSLIPLVERAKILIFKSGTLMRGNKKKIAFLKYDESGGLRAPLILQATEKQRIIRYSRSDALKEHAILPIYFERVDGQATWLEDLDSDEPVTVTLSKAEERTAAAIYTVLREEYALQLLDAAIDHWLKYLKFNPRSKILIIAPNISLGKKYLKHAAKRIGERDVDIATSDDTEEARTNIDRLKGRTGPPLKALVTVAMAYVGMDCPQITHIACLTHIRANGWIEQMLARATRVDKGAHGGSWEKQAAYVWAPDDSLFSQAIEQIRTEQDPYILMREEIEKPPSGSPAPSMPSSEILIPINGVLTDITAFDMQTGEICNAEEAEKYRKIGEQAGFGHLSPIEIKRIVDAAKNYKPEETTPSFDQVKTLTESEEEREIRKTLDEKVHEAGNHDRERIVELNGRLKRLFKERDQMTLPELKAALQYVKQWNAKNATPR